MTLDLNNVIGSALIAAICFGTLVAVQSRDDLPHIRTFLWLWGILTTSLLVNYLVFSQNESRAFRYLSLSLDAFGNALILMGAYALFRGPSFTTADPYFKGGYAVGALFIVYALVVDAFVPMDGGFWRMFYIAPLTLVAAVAFAATGVAAVLEPRARAVRWPLLILFLVYAFLQLPGYFYIFIAKNDSVSEGVSVIKLLCAVGKFALALAFIGALLASQGSVKARHFIGIARVTTWLFSIGFTIFVLLYKVLKSINVTTPP